MRPCRSMSKKDSSCVKKVRGIAPVPPGYVTVLNVKKIVHAVPFKKI